MVLTETFVLKTAATVVNKVGVQTEVAGFKSKQNPGSSFKSNNVLRGKNMRVESLPGSCLWQHQY